MSTLKTELLLAMQRIAAALTEMDEDDISKIVDDAYTLEIRLVRKRNKEDSSAKAAQIDAPAIIAKLAEFSSREDAQKFLDENFGGKRLLELIARSLDIPIMKQDRVDTLRDKIIESTVGARMRSQAIQGGQS